MRITRVGLLAAAVAALLLAPTAPTPASASAQAPHANAVADRPDFLLPFPCNSVIELKTYAGHNPDDKKIDMYRQGMREGSPILASADGYVHENFSPGGLEIRHGGGWFTTYMHMTGVVPAGTWVKRGDVVGYMGDVGSEGRPHLHYEQLYNPTSDQDADNQHIVNPVLQGQGPLVMNPDNPITMTSANCGVSAGSSLFAQSPDRSGVFQWSGNGTAWNKVGGAAGTLYAGGAGVFATNPSTGDLYKMNGPNNWAKVGGPAKIFAVTGNGLFGLSPDGSGVFQWSGNGTTWNKVGGAAGTLYAGGAGLFATNPTNGDLYKMNGPNNWAKVGGPGKIFAVTGNGLFGLSPDGSGVFQWSGNGTTWNKVGGAAGTLYAGGAGLFATNPTTGDLYKMNGPNNWAKVGGAGHQFAVAGDAIYGLSPNSDAVFKWSGTGTTWLKVGGPASFIAGR
ncbi:peptidoglycan DD-metalloendopeptidase family protein [Streptomyces sp. NPDC059385]|uniref:peptidoglycan DD-metalloendopeptidase family protein n=1 Tax=Streptomyces sp. NPDC059385 TaxID=3346817 RepID=UPI0036B51123